MYDGSTALRGEATFFEVMANNPDLLRWYINGFYGDVFKSGRVPKIALEVLRCVSPFSMAANSAIKATAFQRAKPA